MGEHYRQVHGLGEQQQLTSRLGGTGHRYAVAGLVLLLSLVGAVQLAASFVRS
jgi:hypothetical protein